MHILLLNFCIRQFSRLSEYTICNDVISREDNLPAIPLSKKNLLSKRRGNGCGTCPVLYIVIIEAGIHIGEGIMKKSNDYSSLM